MVQDPLLFSHQFQYRHPNPYFNSNTDCNRTLTIMLALTITNSLKNSANAVVSERFTYRWAPARLFPMNGLLNKSLDWWMCSVTAMLQKLQWDSLQQWWAHSRVLMLYQIQNGLVAIPTAAYLEPVPICARRFEMRRADSVQYRHIQSDRLSKCNPAVEHSANRHLPAICWQFQDPSQQSSLLLNSGLLPAFVVCTALFLSEVTVHCLPHSFLNTHLLIHSWCDIARNRVGTIIGRWRRTGSCIMSRDGYPTHPVDHSLTFVIVSEHWLIVSS